MRRESTDPKDLFIAHIGAMDSFARGLRNAAKIVQDGILDCHLKVVQYFLLFFIWKLITEWIVPKKRYATFEVGLGKRIANGEATLEECEEFIREQGEPKQTSGQQEHCESIFNRYI